MRHGITREVRVLLTSPKEEVTAGATCTLLPVLVGIYSIDNNIVSISKPYTTPKQVLRMLGELE